MENAIEIYSTKPNLKGLTLQKLKDYFDSIGEPSFRAEQVFNWMYDKFALSFDEMKNLPKSLRSKLADNFNLATLNYYKSESSPHTGTKKIIFEQVS